MDLQIGRPYLLSGMNPNLWSNAHVEFGQPNSLSGVYLGHVSGKRTWHLFEIHIGGKEEGVLMMTTKDLEKLVITEL